MKKQSAKKPSKMICLLNADYPAYLWVGKKFDLVVFVIARRIDGGEIIEQKLRCLMRVGKSTADRYMKTLNPYQIIEAEFDKVIDEKTIRIARILKTKVSDTALQKIAVKLQKPIVLSHPEFGKLRYNRQFEFYEGKVKWGNKTVKLQLSCNDPESAEPALKVATRLFKSQSAWNAKLEKFVVKEMLDDKNETWLEEGEKKLDSKKFLSRLKLDVIDIYDDRFAFWYDDGNLFWGHGIEVTGNLKDGLEHASLQG